MIDTFFVLLMIGKLIMYLARKAPYFRYGGFLTPLLDCELCLGVWVYGALSLVFGFYVPIHTFYIPILSNRVS